MDILRKGMDQNDLNSHAWDSNLPNPLSSEQMAKFQHKLNAVVGRETDGTERWKLLWAPNQDTWIWNRYKDRWEPHFEHYWADAQVTYQDTQSPKSKKKRGIDTIVVNHPIALPRFWIGALVPAVHRNAKDDAAGVDEFGTRFSARRYRGPEYVNMFTITQHSELTDPETKMRLCCQHRLTELDVTCKGDFRVPDDQDIVHLQQMLQARIGHDIVRPDESLTAYDKNKLWALARQTIDKEIANRKAVMADLKQEYALQDFINIHNRSNRGAIKNHYSIPGL